jgi:hypothetical protein
MIPTDTLRAGSEELGRATARLGAALAEQDRVTGRLDAAIGTSSEMNAYTDLREAGEQVSARDAWVKWLERDY